MELNIWGRPHNTKLVVSVGRQNVGRSSIWVDTANNRIYSIQKEITTTEDTVTICTTTTPMVINACDVRDPVINTVTLTKKEYFKRKLAGEFGDL